MEKVVIITGASSGIGLEMANLFASNGYKVYGLSRKEFKTNNFTHLVCDVCDTKRVEEVFSFIEEKEGHIDIVINNAGMGISGAVEFLNETDMQKIFNVNVFAVMNISKISLKYLRKTKGKIINISSVASIFSIPFQSCYSATKSAIEKFSLALANEVKSQKIKVICVRPGDTKTGFTKNRVKTETTSEIYKDKVKNSVKKMEKDEQNGMNPIKVAKVVLKASKRKNPPLIKTVGFSYKFLSFLEKILPVKLVNFIVGKLY